jgi:hypothetical protein
VQDEGYTIPPNMIGLNRLGGSTCNAFTGYCNDNGVCETVSADTPLSLLTDVNITTWIWDNWWIIVLIEIGLVLVAFLLRWTNQKRDTSYWVHAQYRNLQGRMSDQARAAFKTISVDKAKRRKSSSLISKRRENRRRKERQLKEVAILYGESRKMNLEVQREREREEAFARLKVLFPYTEDHVLRKIISLSPDEEVAVGRLLTLGHAMWKVDDYKLLHYAVKRYRKENRRKKAHAEKGKDIEGVPVPKLQNPAKAVPRKLSTVSFADLPRKTSSVAFDKVEIVNEDSL